MQLKNFISHIYTAEQHTTH